MSKLMAILAVAGGIATSAAPAFAQAVQAGFVSPAGVVSGNGNFTGTQTGTGAYQIVAPQSLFPDGFPVMTVTPFGEDGGYAAAVVDFELCENGSCVFGVHILSLKTGKPQNNSWLFHVIQD